MRRLDAGGFGSIADDLLDPVDIGCVLADLLRKFGFQRVEAVGVDVFGGVDTEAEHAVVVHAGHVVRFDILDLLGFRIEVEHTQQTALLDLLLILIIRNLLGARVEVRSSQTVRIRGCRESGERAGIGCVLAAVRAGVCSGLAVRTWGSGVVHDHIGDDAHALRLADGDHVLEFSFGAKLRIKLVAHRLV